MGRLVLIVDDSPQCATNLEIALLGLSSIQVVIASSGVEALKLLPSGVAAIITDLEMPCMDGFELIERVRADSRYARLPIIVLSGNTDPGVAERVRRLGANAFFLKPYSPAVVRNKLEQLLNANEL
jgi:CheY-like chemotaxis protein